VPYPGTGCYSDLDRDDWENHPKVAYLLILSVGVLIIHQEGDAYDPRH